MKKNNTTKRIINKQITKWSLVICFLFELTLAISLFTTSFLLHDFTFIYAFLLLLIPNLIYVIVSLILPNFDIKSSSKKQIIFLCILFALKYILLIGMLAVGMIFDHYFNKWVILTMTLWPPIFVIIYKIIFANIVSKKDEKSCKI